VDEPRPTDLDELSHNECYADTIFELELEWELVYSRLYFI
jgi:hypothetical protein